MTEADARAWIAERFPDAIPRLDRFLDLLTDEAIRQNLVAASTLPQLWTRHVLDSAQLIPLAAAPSDPWLDIGTGAGFPGLVIAILTGAPVTCVEPRARRVEWLTRAACELALDTVTVEGTALASVATSPFATITARAVAPLPKLLAMSERFAMPATRWLLPKGASAHDEVDAGSREWQGVFHVEPSLTDAAAGIVVAHGLRRKGPGRRA